MVRGRRRAHNIVSDWTHRWRQNSLQGMAKNRVDRVYAYTG